MNIAKSIKVGMAKKDVTQWELRAELSVSEVTVSRWANGKSIPSTDKLEKLASVFNVKVSEFISWGE